MQRGLVHKVIVGADRIAANGDAANKIGTFGVALLAKEFGIPFYVAAPVSTIDPETADGSLIPIEDRTPREVTHVGTTQITPDGVGVFNFAFDVDPGQAHPRHHHRKGRAHRALHGGHRQAFQIVSPAVSRELGKTGLRGSLAHAVGSTVEPVRVMPTKGILHMRGAVPSSGRLFV